VRQIVVASLTVLTCAACASQATPEALPLSAEQVKAIAEEVETVARASEASWKSVTCEDLSPALQYWDGSPPGLVHSHEEVMRTFSDTEWAAQIKGNVCSSGGSGESFVDSILVSVLSNDVATATMSYHAILKDTQGKATNREGQILRVFRRTPGGWKIRVSMSTHSDLQKK